MPDRHSVGIRVMRFGRVVFLAATGVVAWVIAGLLDGQRTFGQIQVCSGHMKTLSLSMGQYAMDWDETYPPRTAWGTDLAAYSGSRRPTLATTMHCPGVASRYGYALNEALGGIHTQAVDLTNCVMLFESDADDINASGSYRDMAKVRHRHLNVAYCDGHARTITMYDRKIWVWKPGKL